MEPSPRFSAKRLLPLLLTVLTGCDDPQRISTALEALKEREARVLSGEASQTERQHKLQQQEQAIADALLALEKQRGEILALRRQVEQEALLVKERQEALLRREKRGPAPTVTAGRVIVIDPASGEVLAEKNADKKEAIASTQKILTALLIIEAGGLDETVTITKEDSDCAPVKIGMTAGEKYTRRQLLTALMVRSYNDIARALARDHSGSIGAFASRMNERAKELGMTNSRFINPNGLPAEGQYSTARDISIAARIADALPDLRAMVSTRSFAWKRANGRYDLLENTNRVLRTCQWCDGIKTGYTDAAGYCLVASGQKDGRRRIVVVLNGTRDGVWKEAQALLEWSLKA